MASFTDPAHYALANKTSPILTATHYRTTPLQDRLPGPSDLRRSASTYSFEQSRARPPSPRASRSTVFRGDASYPPIESYESQPAPRSAFASRPFESSAFDGGYREPYIEDERSYTPPTGSSRQLYRRHSALMTPESPSYSRFDSYNADPISSAFAGLSAMPAPRPPVCICRQCGQECRDMEELEAHKREEHTKEKPHRCGYCTMSFTRRYDCERHERIHSGEKPYSCPRCPETFARRDALNRHIQMQCRTIDTAAPHGPLPASAFATIPDSVGSPANSPSPAATVPPGPALGGAHVLFQLESS